jgi:hypothetical protein
VIPPAIASATVIATFGLFMVVAQVVRTRNVARRGASTRRAEGIAHTATYFFWLPYLIIWLRVGPSLDPPPASVWIGLALASAGIAFALWAMATLGEHYDLTLEIHGGHRVVREGPCAIRSTRVSRSTRSVRCSRRATSSTSPARSSSHSRSSSCERAPRSACCATSSARSTSGTLARYRC